MTTLIDTMAADAVKRQTQRINRSAGQHKRALHHEPPPVEPVNHFYEAGNVIEFAGDEPEEHADGLAMFGRRLGALIGLVLLAALATYFYIKF